MLELESGKPLDEVLESYARLAPEIYQVLGANTLPIDEMAVVEG